MLKMYLPSVPPVIGGNVIVPKETWSELVRYIDQMHECINAQADTIVNLKKELEKTNGNIKILAESVEGLYDESV